MCCASVWEKFETSWLNLQEVRCVCKGLEEVAKKLVEFASV